MTFQTSEERIADYRRQADDARRKAGRATDPSARNALLEVADAWDRLAELERQELWPPAVAKLASPAKRSGK